MEKEFFYEPVDCIDVPKMLFEDERYSMLSTDAKLLYSLLLDRKSMSQLNGWIDEDGEAYVVYPRNEMEEHLNASRYRVAAAMDELQACDQMVRVTLPKPGKPRQIYVKDITAKMEEEEMSMKDNKDIDHDGMIVMLDIDDLRKAVEKAERIEKIEAAACRQDWEEDEELGLLDACTNRIADGFGCEIGSSLSNLLVDAPDDVFSLDDLFDYIEDLHTAGKFKRIEAIIIALAYLFEIDTEYFVAMKSCKGWRRKAFINQVLESATLATLEIEDDEE